MVKKIGIWFIILFIAINAVFEFIGDIPFVLDNPSVKIRNDYKFEQFFLEDNSSIYIIGSSLAASIMNKHIEGSRNLGVEGSNAIVAQRMINRFNKTPKQIVIETNTLFDEPDSTLYQLFDSYKYDFGLYNLPMMKIENRLITGLVMHSARLFEKFMTYFPKGSIQKQASDFVKTERVLISIKEIEIRLQKIIKDYHAKGTRVLFVEIPCPKLTQKTQSMTRSLMERLEVKDFITWDNHITLDFPDGTHLSNQSSTIFSKWLQEKIK